MLESMMICSEHAFLKTFTMICLNFIAQTTENCLKSDQFTANNRSLSADSQHFHSQLGNSTESN